MTDSVPVQPNPSATYSDQRTQSVIAHRSHVKISPKYGGKFKAGSIIRLEIPSQDWLDPDLFSISFLAKLWQQNGTSIPQYGSLNHNAISMNTSKFLRFDTPVQCVFSRIKLLQGSTVLEDIQDYAVLMKILTAATVNKQYERALGGSFEGQYDPRDYEQVKEANTRHTYGTVASSDESLNRGWYYNVRPLLGLMRAGKYLPLKWMGQLTIELYCAENIDCLVSSTDDGAAIPANGQVAAPIVHADPPTSGTTVVPASYPNSYYELDEVYMECHFVQPIEEYDRSALSLIEEKGLEIWFDTFSTHNRQLKGVGKATNSFQERAVSLKGGYAVMQNEHDLGDYRTPICFPDNNIEEYQWKIGSHYIPAQPIKCRRGAGIPLAQLQNSFDALGDLSTTGKIDSVNYTGTRFSSSADLKLTGNYVNTTALGQGYWECIEGTSMPNNFVMALNLERSPDQLSGFNSAAASVDVELMTNLKNIATDTTLDVALIPNGQASRAIASNGHSLQPSKYRVQHVLTGVAAAGDPASSDKWENAAGLGNLNIYNLPYTFFTHTKAPNTYARLTFFAHIDAVMKVERIGSVQIMR